MQNFVNEKIKKSGRMPDFFTNYSNLLISPKLILPGQHFYAFH